MEVSAKVREMFKWQWGIDAPCDTDEGDLGTVASMEHWLSLQESPEKLSMLQFHEGWARWSVSHRFVIDTTKDAGDEVVDTRNGKRSQLGDPHWYEAKGSPSADNHPKFIEWLQEELNQNEDDTLRTFFDR